MSSDASDFQLICPQCGAIHNSKAVTCRGCGATIGRGGAPARRPARQAPARSPMLPDFPLLLKVMFTVAGVTMVGWLLYLGAAGMMKSIETPPTYPDDPVETLTQFFNAMGQEDYQTCYGLLTMDRKIATVVKQTSRASYFDHFARIGAYLVDHLGEDFPAIMQVTDDNRRVYFGQDFALNVSLASKVGPDKKSHYALNEIKDFPMDIAPAIGIEQRNRQVNRVMESIGALGQPEQDDDSAVITETRPYESQRERVSRLIEAFKNQRQLDTRHTLLDWIIKEFIEDRAAQRLLYQVADDENELPQLRLLAEDYLDQ